ncbi:uncharacterized protein LOC134190742 [Corticium candelabrum]|uniref:uncharacterized protein LOC134190742 n=1 Tax=Corticium candelabrum TaxID=121492 RepID=UPI002E26A930|nr:uncharacterized protein LOC134190742 [Corticium candelabrum]
MGLSSLDNNKWDEAVLKINYGGLGLTSVGSVLPSSFIAAWAHSFNELPKRFPQMADEIGHLVSNVSTKHVKPSGTSIGASLTTAIDNLPFESSEESTDPQQRSCHDLFSKPTKLQLRRSDSSAKSSADKVFSSFTSDKDNARVRSVTGKASSA